MNTAIVSFSNLQKTGIYWHKEITLLASLLSSDSGLLPAPFAQRSTNSPKPPLWMEAALLTGGLEACAGFNTRIQKSN